MVFFACLCYGSCFAAVASVDEKNVYLAVENFGWKEFDDDNSRIVKESGTLVGVGFMYQKEFANHVTLRPAAEVFGGPVDYDGTACDINTRVCQPATTTVDYFGLKLQGDVGRRFDSERGRYRYIEPFGGLGMRIWDRNINNGTAADGSATAGYLERWITLHARLGVRGGIDISDRTNLFAEAGLKLPLYNENTAYQNIVGRDVTVKPGKQVSVFAEAGMKISRFKASLFYDGLRFSRSDVVDVGGGLGFLQPRSTNDIYGLKLGAVF